MERDLGAFDARQGSLLIVLDGVLFAPTTDDIYASENPFVAVFSGFTKPMIVNMKKIHIYLTGALN